MILGCTMGKLEGGSWNTCALGVAANAVGIAKRVTITIFGFSSTWRRRIGPMQKMWPWLKEDIDAGKYFGMFTWLERISGRFEHEVCDWVNQPDPAKFEELVAYVRSIEPSCGDCNRFQCSCAPAEIPAPTEDAAIILEDETSNLSRW
jgi:hypothetical protein